MTAAAPAADGGAPAASKGPVAGHPEITRVRMVCFDSRTRAAYEAALAAQECAG